MGRGKEEGQPPDYNEEGSKYFYYGPEPQHQNPQDQGLVRTDLEPKSMVGINTIGVASLTDTGSSLSLIDITLCRFFRLHIHLFPIPHFFTTGIEGEYMVFGKGQIELSIPGLVVMSTRFWVTDIVHPNASSVQIGCHLLREIYEEVDQTCLSQWPTHWKELFE